MTPVRSLAAAQTVPIRGDVDANLEQHVRLVQTAAEASARLLVFPELSLTGYELDLANELAFSETDARLAPLVDRAATHRMTLVVGAPVRIGRHLYLGAFILSPDRAVALYTKHHLGAFPSSASPDGLVPPAEHTVFQPGDRNPLLPFGPDTAAVAICADTGRPSHPQRAADLGAKFYLASMFVIPSDLENDTANLSAYAVRHSMTVVLSNYGGPTGGLPAAGSSAIWSEKGERLARLPESGAGIVVASEARVGEEVTSKSEPAWRARTIELDL